MAAPKTQMRTAEAADATGRMDIVEGALRQRHKTDTIFTKKSNLWNKFAHLLARYSTP